MLNEVKNSLVQVTLIPLERWDTINFGILPNEPSKGIVFPSSVNQLNSNRSVTDFLVGILVSNVSFNDLASECLELANLIYQKYGREKQCTENGMLELLGDIDISTPQSYSNQSNISNTNGFFTSVSFALRLN